MKIHAPYTLALFSLFGLSATSQQNMRSPVLADLGQLEKLHVPVEVKDTHLGLGVSELTDDQRDQLSIWAHQNGRCGGFELLEPKASLQSHALFSALRQQDHKNNLFKQAPIHYFEKLEKKPFIDQAVQDVSADNLKNTVEWYSAFESRFEKDPTYRMTAVEALKQKLEALVGEKAKVEFISHKKTAQQSIRVTFTGSLNPDEIIVLGAHLDSVNWADKKKGFGRAPGADDNGSGTANLVELTRLLAQSPQPERSIEVFFYAAEETGLIGSGEIAQTYKDEHKNVIGVLQLDMTLFPGSGEGKIGLIGDFTSDWLRSYLTSLNDLYQVGATFIESKCGYACSDHASWYRRGFATVFPFEAEDEALNPEIHSSNDAINDHSSFTHSARFSKLAVAFALDLANSNLSAPK